MPTTRSAHISMITPSLTADPIHAAPGSAVVAPGTGEILIVDDEPIVLSALQFTLEREGFHVTTCSSPLKALALLMDRPFSVIISDQRMPEMMGLDFLVESFGGKADWERELDLTGA